MEPIQFGRCTKRTVEVIAWQPKRTCSQLHEKLGQFNTCSVIGVHRRYEIRLMRGNGIQLITEAFILLNKIRWAWVQTPSVAFYIRLLEWLTVSATPRRGHGSDAKRSVPVVATISLSTLCDAELLSLA